MQGLVRNNIEPSHATFLKKLMRKGSTVDSRYSLIANSGKSRFSGFFQVSREIKVVNS